MLSTRIGLLALLLWAPASAAPLPPSVSSKRLQTLLQRFVDQAYRHAFRHLGEERDFDHAHFLYASNAPDAQPVAVLYHTQELALYEKPGSDYGWLDPEGRNWVQWIADGRVENARRYALEAAPPGYDLLQLRRHHTILADMLDPAAFGAAKLVSRQVVFTRAACTATALRIRLPTEGVCLSLSSY